MKVFSSPPRSSLKRLARTTPLVLGSVLLHAGIAMALVASGGSGHARASITLPVASIDLEVAPVEAPTLEPVREEAPPPQAAHHEEASPAHTHAYLVAPSHDAHPHDPSLHHDEAPAAPAHGRDHEVPQPAEAAPAQVAEPAALPRFTIASGAGLLSGGHVSATGTGSGAGAGAETTTSAPSDDVIVPASGVQVAAKLVHSVAAAYPVDARADDVEGDVGIEIVVDREGRVVEARVVRPAGHGFDDAALAAIRRYRFSAAQREGHAVRVRMPWSVQFRLR